jgi:hypothetical protein
MRETELWRMRRNRKPKGKYSTLCLHRLHPNAYHDSNNEPSNKAVVSGGKVYGSD